MTIVLNLSMRFATVYWPEDAMPSASNMIETNTSSEVRPPADRVSQFGENATYLHCSGLKRARRSIDFGEPAAKFIALYPPRVRQQEVLPFTHEQALALIESSKSDRLHAMYALALSLGLRKGELLGLSWDDVDFKQDTLRVRYSLQRLGEQGLVLCEPKTARDARSHFHSSAFMH